MFSNNEVLQQLEQFCSAKNISTTKFKNLLRSCASNSSSSSVTSSPTISSPSIPRNLSSNTSPSSPCPSPLPLASATPVALPSSSPSTPIAPTPPTLFSPNSFVSILPLASPAQAPSSPALSKRSHSSSSEEEKSLSPHSKRLKNGSLSVTCKLGLTFEESQKGCVKMLNYWSHSPCPRCIAKGEITRTCEECSGAGKANRSRYVEVDVPELSKSGDRKIFKGKGHIADDGRQIGDLIVEFEVENHSFYTRNGDNACCQISISVFQAVLGTRMHIPKLYAEGEKYELTIEPGTQPGELIRIPQMGFRKANCKKKRGDLEILVQVEIPKHLTKEQTELFERLAAIDSIMHLSRGLSFEFK